MYTYLYSFLSWTDNARVITRVLHRVPGEERYERTRGLRPRSSWGSRRNGDSTWTVAPASEGPGQGSHLFTDLFLLQTLT